VEICLVSAAFGNKVDSTFMPNQLSSSKRRQSLAEHEVVLGALSALAQMRKTTAMDLLRRSTREYLHRAATDPKVAIELRAIAISRAPRVPLKFKTAAQVARFKRRQREYDRALLDLGLASPTAIQERNSIVGVNSSIRLINFGQSHAATR
jgi:hypothetical protein